MNSSNRYSHIPGYNEDNHFLFKMLDDKGKLRLLEELAGIMLENPCLKFSNNVKFLAHFKDSETTAMCLNDDLVKLLNATDEEYEKMLNEKKIQSKLWKPINTSGIIPEKVDFLTLFINSVKQHQFDDDKPAVDDEPAVGYDNPAFLNFSGETSANKRRRDELPAEINKLKNMQDKLSENIIGQDHAVQAFITGMFRAMTKNASGSRRGVKAIYTFAGPPGVGKTFLAETASEMLGLPFKRFDMTEYSDRNSTVALIGFEHGWKDAKAGVLTDYVRENPKAVLLFDEIEKAHSEVLMLFYQILDGGYLVDKYYESMKISTDPDVRARASEPKVDFKNTIIIFTSNVGRSIYEDENYINGSEVSEQTLLNALRTERNLARDGENFFPAALVSRISTGTVVMFNKLEPPSLTRITENIFHKVSKEFKERYNIEFAADKKLFLSLLFSVGGQADARMLTAKTDSFFRDEVFKILKADPNCLININRIIFEVELPEPDIGNNFGVSEQDDADGTVSSENEIYSLYYPEEKLNILAYARSADISELVKIEKYNIFSTDNAEEAAAIAANQNIDLILIDISLQKNDSNLSSYLSPNASVWKVGKGLFDRLRKTVSEVPIYLLDNIYVYPLPQELINGFVRSGARGVIKITYDLVQTVTDICDIVYMQKSAGIIARGHRQLDFETVFVIPEEGGDAVIKLRNLELNRAPLANDVKTLLKDIDVPKDRFDDIVGAKSAKEVLENYKGFFENPRRFTADGRKAPKGVLLYGSPGTGKTMLARAMAGECGVTFIPTAAAELQSQKDVKKLFSTARKYAPAIIFIDEADTFGKQRTGHGGYTEDILNSVLAEMDGFRSDTRRPVFVLAATNYGISGDSDDLIGVMDEAFVRRFDRCIRIELPDTEERRELIIRFLKRLGDDRHTVLPEQIEEFAGRTWGRSPSEINNVLESALQESHGHDKLKYDHINKAYEEWKLGAKKADPDDKTLRITACHESGHALINWLCGHIPSYLTIESRRNYGGYMEHSEKELNLSHRNKTNYLGNIRCALGGRAAEIVYYGKEIGVNTGAYSDLESATRSARNMVSQLGMDERFGIAVMGRETANNSEKLRERVNEILSEELEKAIKDIEANKPKMDKLIDALIKKRRLSGDEIKKILSDKD